MWGDRFGKSWDGLKYKNLNILRTEHNFLGNKKILHMCFKWYILRSDRFVAEVTFKHLLWCKNYFGMDYPPIFRSTPSIMLYPPINAAIFQPHPPPTFEKENWFTQKSPWWWLFYTLEGKLFSVELLFFISKFISPSVIHSGSNWRKTKERNKRET